MDFTIKKMTFEDIDNVLVIEQNSFTQPWTREHFEIEILLGDTSLPLVAIIDNKIVGYIVCWFLVDEIHISTLAIHKAYRRNHLGEKLLNSALLRGINKKLKYAFLEVRVSNLPAIRFYNKFGFLKVGTHSNYYKNGGKNEDAILMTKIL